MGYTHYWHRKEDLSEGWEEFIRDVRTLYENLPRMSQSAGGYYTVKRLRIAGGLGEGEPVFDDEMVWFNGEGEMEHETFDMPRILTERDIKTYLAPKEGFYFNFCKTARKPYDLMVTAVLILAKKHFGGRIKVASDGDWRDWREARKIIENVLGYKVVGNFLER